MTRHAMVTNRKGHITIPAEYRRALALKEGDKGAVIREAGRLTLRQCGSMTARTAGPLGGDEPPTSVDALRAAAEHAIAERALARSDG